MSVGRTNRPGFRLLDLQIID